MSGEGAALQAAEKVPDVTVTVEERPLRAA